MRAEHLFCGKGSSSDCNTEHCNLISNAKKKSSISKICSSIKWCKNPADILNIINKAFLNWYTHEHIKLAYLDISLGTFAICNFIVSISSLRDLMLPCLMWVEESNTLFNWNTSAVWMETGDLLHIMKALSTSLPLRQDFTSVFLSLSDWIALVACFLLFWRTLAVACSVSIVFYCCLSTVTWRKGQGHPLTQTTENGTWYILKFKIN